jgi:hypothetical protein
MRTYKIIIGYKKIVGEEQKEATILEGIREKDLWVNVREIAKQGSPLYVIKIEMEE